MSSDASGRSDAARQMGMQAAAGPFATALIAAAEHRPEIVGLSADLAKYTDMQAFRERFPERFLEIGMAEQNLVAIAGGLAQSGLVPVATTFAAFLTRRAQDFTMMQVALPRANVKLIGAVPGVTAGFGPSHASIDDLAAMRTVPKLVVIDPCDTRELGLATAAALEHDGPVYLRQPFAHAGRDSLDPPFPFVLGRATMLRDGGDVGIVASGFMVARALEAAARLHDAGIEAAVLKVSTLKPFDADAVAALAARTGALVTAENHSIYGALFSATSETVARHAIHVAVEPVAVADVFPPFGSLDHVALETGLTADAIVAAAQQALARRDRRA